MARTDVATTLVCILVPALAGCTVGDRLETVARSLDKWGTVSLSGATLIEPDPRFLLDLDLSGREIFERNRFEGYSNVSQVRTMDVQLAVQAEIVADLLDQMQGTTEPKLLDSLKQRLQAAAFQSLLANLPADQQERLASIFEPVTSRFDSDPAAATVSDAGAGKLSEGEQAISSAIQSVEEAERVASKIEAGVAPPAEDASDEDKEKAAAAENQLEIVQANLQSAATRLREASGNFGSAAGEALSAAIEAQKRLEALPSAEQRSATAESAAAAQAAATASRTARDASDALAKKIDEQAAKLAETDEQQASSYRDRANALVGLLKPLAQPTTTDFPHTGPGVQDATRNAVTKAQSAAGLAGVPIGPGRSGGPKMIAAPKLPRKEDRLALERVDKLGGIRELLENPNVTPELNLRQLLLLTASDKMTLEILRWLSHPRGFGPNQQVYLCVASVSVVPGKQTYRGYLGQVDVFFELGFTESDSAGIEQVVVPRPNTVEPTVFAVYPYLDSQVLDLRTSRRRAFSAAIALAVSGYPAAASAFLDYASQTQQDVETVTGVNAVTSYSNGRHLGFTFGPRLVAQADPSDWNTSPQLNLQPQSFPVLIMVVVPTQNAVTGAVHVQKNQAAQSASDKTPPVSDEEKPADTVKISSKPTHVVMYQNSRWMRAPDYRADKFPFGQALSDLFTERLTEREMYARANALDDANRKLRTQHHVEEIDDGQYERESTVFVEPDSRYKISYEKFRKRKHEFKYRDRYATYRLHTLASHAIGTTTVFELPGFLPGSDKLKSLSISPQVGWIDEPNTFFIEAEDGGFDKGFAVSIGGRAVNAVRISDTVLKVVMPPWKQTVGEPASEQNKEEFIAPVAVTNGKNIASAGSVTFRFRQASAATPGPDTATRAAFSGGILTIRPASKLIEDRILRLQITPPIMGVQRGTIIVPLGKDKSPATFDCAVRANGEVVADQDIRMTEEGWEPVDMSSVVGQAIDNVSVKLRLPSGGTTEFEVNGILVIRDD